MKQPSLEEVKEYFKNAEKVKSCYGNTFKYKGVQEGYCNNTFMHKGKVHHTLWSPEKGYAEILTYKEKTFSITESQIKNLKKDIKNGYHVDAIDYLEKLFPETIESEAKELKIGTWYNYNGSIVNYQGIENDILQGYGIRHSDKQWMSLGSMGSSPEEWREATEQEVFEALKNEAVKRGFKEGVFIHRPFGTDLNDHVIDKNNFPDDGDFYYNLKDNYLECYGFVVFSKGEWAEIIPTITLSEAEQQLKKKIIV